MSSFTMFYLAEAWAAAAPAAHGHAPSMTSLIYPIINFLIFAFLIYRFVLPPARLYLASRRDEILGAVRSADERKEKADSAVRAYRDRLASVDDETKTLLETLRAEGERERAKILREAAELASKIKADADFVSQQEIKIARQQIREEIAQIARETAESAIRANFRAADQERLVEQFLHGIEGVR